MPRKDAAAAAADQDDTANTASSRGGAVAGGDTTQQKKKTKKEKRPHVDRTVRWWHHLVTMEAFLLYVVAGVALSTLLAHLGYKGRESVVGIDLGTTFSVVAIRRNDGEVEVVPNKHGKLTTPSVVSYQRSGRALVGADAVAVQEKNFRTTIYNAKRFIGKRFTDAGVAQDAADHPFRVLQGPALGKEGTGDIYFDVKNNPVSPRLVSPEEVGREVIESLMEDVKRHLGHSQVGGGGRRRHHRRRHHRARHNHNHRAIDCVQIDGDDLYFVVVGDDVAARHQTHARLRVDGDQPLLHSRCAPTALLLA